MPSSELGSPRAPMVRARDHRLDFWRGLCLIDMVVVHLYYERAQFGEILGPWLGQYTRFAAGGFVFVGGLAAGAIFFSRALVAEQRMSTYRRLWTRSLRILLWQYGLAVAWLGLGVLRGSAEMTSPGRTLMDILRMRSGGDLLPLYVILIAATPAFLEILRRKWGACILAAVAVAVFAFARFHPYALALDPQGAFPPLLWQILFVAGLLAGCNLKKYDRWSSWTKFTLAISAWTVFAFLFWCEYWRVLNWPACPIDLAFAKTPLTSAEMLRYLAITIAILVSTDLFWARLRDTNFAGFAQLLGRNSLAVYVVQVFLVELFGYLSPLWWRMGAWQLTFVPACLSLLLVSAAVAEQKWITFGGMFNGLMDRLLVLQRFLINRVHGFFGEGSIAVGADGDGIHMSRFKSAVESFTVQTADPTGFAGGLIVIKSPEIGP
jgi:hypothetical protein